MPPEDNEPQITSQDQSPTSDDTTASADSFLEGTYNGQKVSFSEEEARRLAQKGLDYETKKQKLMAEKEAFASDQEDFDRFKAWRESLQADPRRAEAVAAAWQNPDSVLNPQQHDDDDELAPRRAPAQPSTPPEVHQLRSQIEQLQSKLDGFTSNVEAEKSGQALERAVDSFSFLSSNPDAKDSAIEMARGLMAQDPEMSPEGAAAVAANKLKAIVQGQKQQKLDRKGKAEEMRTLDTKEGVPVGGSEKEKKEQPYGQRRRTTLRGDMLKEFTEGKFRERFPNAFQ